MPTAKQVKMRRGTTLDNDLFIGAEGEVTVDVTTSALRVHNGIKLGGTEVARADLGNVPENTDFEQRILDAVQALLEAGGGTGGSGGIGGEAPVAIGGIKSGFASPGEDYLLADGAFVSKTEYPELYLAIGDRYAIDGSIISTFNASNAGSTQPNGTFNDFAVNGNTVVVAGGTGFYTVSTNAGASWTTVSDGSNVLTQKVVYGGGKFVAVGNSKIATSNDGLAWTVKNDITANFTQAFYLNNRFFIFAPAAGTAQTSTDGVTWTPMTMPLFSTVVPLCGVYNSVLGLYVIAGASAALMTSPDGVTWTSRTSNMTNAINAIDFNNSMMVAVGGNGTTTANIATTTDGITWTARSNTIAQSRSSLAWWSFGNMWVSGGNNALIATSLDGITWTTVASGLSTANPVTSVVATPSTVVVGSAAGTSYSTTGTAFTVRQPSGFSRASTKIIRSSNGDVWYVGNNITYANCNIAKSVDNGVSAYLLYNGFSSPAGIRAGVVTSEVGLVGFGASAVGSDVNGTTFSVFDFQTNQNRPIVVGVGAPVTGGAAYLGGRYFVYGMFGGLATSTDGFNWTTSFDFPTTLTINRIEYNGVDRYVLTGSNGSIFHSSDGLSWTPATHNATGVNITQLVYNKTNSRWYAGGTHTALLTSTNGTIWTDIDLPGSTAVVKILFTKRYLAFATTTTMGTTPIATPGNWLISTTPGRSRPSANDDLFITVGNHVSTNGTNTGAVPVAFTSADGLSWASSLMNLATTSGNVNATPAATQVINIGQGFLALGGFSVDGSGAYSVSGGFQFTSNDGYNWTQSFGPSNVQLDSVATFSDDALFVSGLINSSNNGFGMVKLPDPTTFKLPYNPPANGYLPNNYIRVT